MNFSDKQIADGRRRLKKLLPAAKDWVRTEGREPGTQMEIMSARGQATHGYITYDNLKSLVVHRTSKGWYADMILKKTPAGISNVLGTPTDMPLESREKAEEEALNLMKVMALQASMNEGLSRDTKAEDVRPFQFYAFEILLPGEAVDICVSTAAMIGQTEEQARDYANGKMTHLCDENGITEATTFDEMTALAADGSIYNTLMTLSCMLCSTGMSRFPLPDWVHAESLEDDDVPELPVDP